MLNKNIITDSMIAREVARLLKIRSATGRGLRCILAGDYDGNGYISTTCVEEPKTNDIDAYIETILPYIRKLQDHCRFIEKCYVLKLGMSGAVANFDGVSVRVTKNYNVRSDKKEIIIELAHE